MNSSLELFNELNYKNLTSKDSTDELFEIYKSNWLYGSCHKSVLNFLTFHKETFLLEIATNCYLIWLKRGFHYSVTGLSTLANTSTDIRIQHYSEFISIIENYYGKNEFYLNNLNSSDAITKIGNMFKCFSYNGWDDITEDKLLHIYCLAYIVWNVNFYKQGLGGKNFKLKEKLLEVAIKFFEDTDYDEEDLVLLVENQINAISEKDANV